MTAYYNEFDKQKAAWLRELIRMGMIAPGEVDERSIHDVRADDLRGFTQCHFFAGIGVWSYALRQAGWPDEGPVWTGSCPCQPFSAAGKRKGTADERHLWPEWFRLVRECRPTVIFGEQVASKGGMSWLDLVYADLEGQGYSVGALDLCAAGVGAPHIRQRLYFVGDSKGEIRAVPIRQRRSHKESSESRGPSVACNGFWANPVWLPCRDGRQRPTKPGIFPLVDGTAGRMGRCGDPGVQIDPNATPEARVMRLKGYGDAIVAPVAVEFIKAYTDGK